MLVLALLLACDPAADPPSPEEAESVPTQDTAETGVDPLETDIVETDPPDSDETDSGGAVETADTGTCDHVDAEVYVVDCGGSWTPLVRWVSATGDLACPPYYALGADTDTDPAALIARSTCEDDCVYSPVRAVMFLYCGVRAEYTEHASGGPGEEPAASPCRTLLRVDSIAGSDWTWDLTDYESSHPCP